jgi:hypothetical protein
MQEIKYQIITRFWWSSASAVSSKGWLYLSSFRAPARSGNQLEYGDHSLCPQVRPRAQPTRPGARCWVRLKIFTSWGSLNPPLLLSAARIYRVVCRYPREGCLAQFEASCCFTSMPSFSLGESSVSLGYSRSFQSPECQDPPETAESDWYLHSQEFLPFYFTRIYHLSSLPSTLTPLLSFLPQKLSFLSMDLIAHS